MKSKRMKNILTAIAVAALTLTGVGCTDYNLVDTGVANGDHQTTMWDYLKLDSYNWDSTRVMIDRANLRSVFEGTSEYGKNITFFGPTNHSIRRYLLANGLKRVSDIPVDECREMLLDCVLPQRTMLDEFVPGRPSADADKVIGTGGKMYRMASGKQLWIYNFRTSYNGVPEAGPVAIFIVSPLTTKTTQVASSNIKTLTGVVHSLDYNFTLKDF